MFVSNVQLVETPEGVVPTLVWLDSHDRIYGVLPHALYLSRKSGLLLFGGWCQLGDWKARILSRLAIVRQDQPIGEVIQSTPEVLNGVPGNEPNVGWNRSNLGDPIDFVSTIRVKIYSDGVRVGLHEGSRGRLEIVDVFVGPIDL